MLYNCVHLCNKLLKYQINFATRLHQHKTQIRKYLWVNLSLKWFNNIFVRINKKLRRRVMNTKLTLTIEQSLIEKAKQYAKSEGRSLSDIVENYLKVIVKEGNARVIDSTPIASSLRGSFKAPKYYDYKKELTKELSKKYLQDG